MTSPAPSRLRRVPWWVWTLAIIATVVAVVALLGGFSSIPEEKLPKVAIGERHTGGELSTVVERAWVSNQQPTTGDFAEEGDQFLIVETRLENVTAAPSAMGTDVLRIEVDGLIEATTEPDVVLDVLRGKRASSLGASVPTTVDFIWVIPADSVATGDTVYMGIFDRFRVYGDPIFGDGAFTRPQVVALLETTVDEVEFVEPPEEVTF